MESKSQLGAGRAEQSGNVGLEREGKVRSL